MLKCAYIAYTLFHYASFSIMTCQPTFINTQKLRQLQFTCRHDPWRGACTMATMAIHGCCCGACLQLSKLAGYPARFLQAVLA